VSLQQEGYNFLGRLVNHRYPIKFQEWLDNGPQIAPKSRAPTLTIYKILRETPLFSGGWSSLPVFQRQAIYILTKEVNSTFSAEQVEKTVIGEITAKTATGFRPIVINFTTVFPVSMFQEDTSFIIRMDHVQLACAFHLIRCGPQTLFPDGLHAHIHSDMTAHFFYKFGFIGLNDNFPIQFATGAALTACMENGFQGIFIGLLSVHFSPYCKVHQLCSG
jgi:hypothetical protein